MERKVQLVRPTSSQAVQIRRVCAYARVSSGKDAMLHSLSAQVSYYQRYIQSRAAWKFCGIYADEAETGTKDSREQFQLMMKECRKGNIDLIITKSITRFARNTVTLLQAVRELKNMGIEIYFEEQNISTLSTEGEVMLTILASYAQEESLSASENAKWRLRRGYENGDVMQWRFLFGYDIKKGRIAINEEKAKIVREIFARFVNGESITGIRKWLREEGVKGEFGGDFTHMRITDMLRNEKYVGDVLLQKYFVNNHLEKKELKNRGELPKYYVEETHPAIIDQETFQKAQVRLAENHNRHGVDMTKPTASPFSGKVVCGNCGANYKRCKNNGRKIWICWNYSDKGKAFCNSKRIRNDMLEQLTLEALNLPALDADAVLELIDKIYIYNFRVVFLFYDGTQVEKTWKYKSQSECWTEEMREKARQRTILQNEVKRLCQR